MNRIARILVPLLRLLLPATGVHRAGWPTPHPAHQPWTSASPYVVTWGRREQARLRRQRRRALWLAVHGVDVGPRRIHGVKVAPR